jgi:hypothetical protein
LAAVAGAERVIDGGITFREVGVIKGGSKSVNRDGEYRTIVSGPRMVGSSGITPKPFEFTCDESVKT